MEDGKEKRNPKANEELLELAKIMQGYKTAEDLTQETDDIMAQVAKVQQNTVEAKKAKKKSQTGLIVIICIVVACICFAGVVALLNAKNSIIVPSVVDLDVMSARDKLEQAGLKVGNIKYDPASKKKGGFVIDQSPKNGTSLPRGTQVTLIVSGAKPNDRFTRPVDENKTSPNTGNSAQTPNQPNQPGTPSTDNQSNKPPEPNVDNTGDKGSTTGSNQQPTEEVKTFVLPDHTGYKYSDVKRELESNGVSVAWRSENNKSYQPGTVIRTEPPANSKVKSKGDNVILVVAK